VLTYEAGIHREGGISSNEMHFIRAETRDQQVSSAIKQQHDGHDSFQMARFHWNWWSEIYQNRAVKSTKGLIPYQDLH
jgi:hypothetical protein